MRLNDLGKLGLGLFVIGLAGIAGFIYDALANVSPGLYADLLGTNLDGTAQFLLFAIMLMLLLLGCLFYFASKTRKREVR